MEEKAQTSSSTRSQSCSILRFFSAANSSSMPTLVKMPRLSNRNWPMVWQASVLARYSSSRCGKTSAGSSNNTAKFVPHPIPRLFDPRGIPACFLRWEKGCTARIFTISLTSSPDSSMTGGGGAACWSGLPLSFLLSLLQNNLEHEIFSN